MVLSAGDAVSHDNSPLIDRDDERQRLRDLMATGVPQLVLMYGRRRVGKTFLLNRVWGDTPAFYFTAAETTPAQNRVALLHAFAEWSGQPLHIEDYPTWRSVFRLMLEYRAPAPFAVTLDEFQYLGEDEDGLRAVASELNAVWEARRPERPLVLILAGSSLRLLERLNTGGGPLYGRFAWQCHLKPFSYWHAGQLAGFPKLRDRATAYGVFGGTPRYLAAIDQRRSLVENVQSLMLDASGEVRDLVRTALLQEQGLRDIPKYQAILRAVGEGRTTLNEIAQSAGLEVGTPLRDKLERLGHLGYVGSSRNFETTSRDPARFRLTDPALQFFYRFVDPWESALATQGARAVWEQHVHPHLDVHMGHVFERVAEEAFYRKQGALGLPVVRTWGRWEGKDHRRTPLEIDIVARLTEGRVLTGAVKWNRTPVGMSVHTHHLDALQRLSESGVKWAHEAQQQNSPLLYIAASGFSPEFRQAATASRETVYLWSLDDLYQDVSLNQ